MSKRKRRVLIITLLGLFVIIGAAAFPIYNFTRTGKTAIAGTILFLNVACYVEIGAFENALLTGWKLHKIALLNLGIILLSMLCRYLLEFGEISNTYNFTLLNILLHTITTFLISMVSYITSKRKTTPCESKK